MNNVLIGGDFNSNSCYHFKENEIQGEESKPTFYMYRNKEKTNNLEIGSFEDWISLSDHMPIILEINDLKKIELE